MKNTKTTTDTLAVDSTTTSSIFYRVQVKTDIGWYTYSYAVFQKLDDAVARMETLPPRMRLMGHNELRVVRVEETIKPTAFRSSTTGDE